MLHQRELTFRTCYSNTDTGRSLIPTYIAAFAIHVIEQEMTFQECLSIARESLESDAALNVLRNYIAFMS